MSTAGMKPSLVLLFSGKRKSGKDYITDLLKEKLGKAAVIIRLSGPLKECYANDNGLDFEKMLSASDYKEKYRLDMINWSTEIRKKDYTYFCRAAEDKYEAKRFPVWLVSDCRRETDVKYFLETYGDIVHTIRIEASDQARTERGWVFTPSIDDMETECGLDNLSHNMLVDNTKLNSGEEIVNKIVEEFLNSK